MTRRGAFSLRILLAVLTATAAGTGCRSAPEAEPAELVIAAGAQPVFALLYLADDLGYFADENLAVRFEPFTSGRDALTAVLEGRADLATVYETPVVHRTLQGHELALLTTLHKSTRNTALVARRDTGIASPEDLRGKTIAVSLDTNGEFFLEVLLTNAGIERSEVRLLDTHPEDMVTVLLAGRADAAATWNRHLSDARQALGEDGSVTFYSDVYTEISVLACLRAFAARHGDALQRLIRAVVRAQGFLRTHEEEAVALVARRLEDAELTTRDPRWEAVTLRAELDHVLLTILRLEAEWFVERGVYAGPVPDFSKSIEPTFLRREDPAAVTIRGTP